ncbi:hypothetical protein GF345_00615 [Candidatus Woesearchaeota archaeon]|nr:hypothetical protein [Candidatus Woesearchaeota archaeon]
MESDEYPEYFEFEFELTGHTSESLADLMADVINEFPVIALEDFCGPAHEYDVSRYGQDIGMAIDAYHLLFTELHIYGLGHATMVNREALIEIYDINCLDSRMHEIETVDHTHESANRLLSALNPTTFDVELFSRKKEDAQDYYEGIMPFFKYNTLKEEYLRIWKTAIKLTGIEPIGRSSENDNAIFYMIRDDMLYVLDCDFATETYFFSAKNISDEDNPLGAALEEDILDLHDMDVISDFFLVGNPAESLDPEHILHYAATRQQILYDLKNSGGQITPLVQEALQGLDSGPENRDFPPGSL